MRPRGALNNCKTHHHSCLVPLAKPNNSDTCHSFTCCRDMLQSTVDNWRILKVYSKFLEVIKNDPWSAVKWSA